MRTRRWLFRVPLAFGVAVTGALFAYCFGAGYLSPYGLYAPSPWNAIVTMVLIGCALVFATRLVRRSATKN